MGGCNPQNPPVATPLNQRIAFFALATFALYQLHNQRAPFGDNVNRFWQKQFINKKKNWKMRVWKTNK